MTRRWWILVLGGTSLLGAGLYWHFSRSAFVSELRWGGDASGGEPYLIEKRQGQPAGFEGELAQYFARELGLPPRFVQRDWAQLPQDLSRRDVDLILNGYEWFPAREDVMTSTIPYFAYRLRLIVRRDSPLKGWDDLRRQPGKPRMRVGVLRDSAAQRYLEQHFAGEVEVEGYDQEGVTGVMLKVGDGSLPATVQDGPAANWYLRQSEFSSLHAVGEPLKPTAFNYYVGYVRKEDRDLKTRLDSVIRKGLQDGTIRTIFEKYGVWDEDQANLLDAGKDWPPQELAERPSRLWFFWNLVLAAGMTVALAVVSFPLAMLLGLGIAVGRLYGPRWLAWILTGYVELTRGTPLLLQLSVIFYFLPAIGLRIHPFWAGVIGLAGNYAAYEAEIYRAGLLALPRGQMEAALALGMKPSVALRRILVPQAFRMVIPPVTNDFIALFKDTSICAAISVTELTARYRNFAVNNPGMILELGLITGFLYLAMSYPLSLLAQRMEKTQHRVEG